MMVLAPDHHHAVACARRTGRPGWRVRALLVLAMMLPSVASAAEEAPPPAAAAPVLEHPPPADELDRGSPRGSVQGYLAACAAQDYERAARHLDLRRAQADGPELARHLRVVLGRTLFIDLDSLSPEATGRGEDGLPSYRDRIGTIETASGKVDVLLQRVPRDDGVRIWKFASPTVAKIPALWDEFGYGPLERYLPAVFFEFQLLNMALWQWIGMLCVVLLAGILSWLLTFVLVSILRPIAHRTDTNIDDEMIDGAVSPFRLASTLVIFRLGLVPLGLDIAVLGFVSTLVRATFIIVAAWLLSRLADALSHRVEGQLLANGQASASTLVPPGRKAVKAAILAVAAVAVLDAFGFSVTALIAGLGVGGIAVALAAQKTVENLFGGFTLYADRPVQVGDFCKFGDRVGTVEEIGLRSTRIRTLDRTLVSVPNAEFSSLHLENYAERDRMWLHPVIGLLYETTPDQLRYVLVEIRKMLYAHPRVLRDPARVRFANFGAYSLDLEVFAYVDTRDWNEFLGIREDVYLRIMDIVEASGTGFAFPSQTLYLGKDAGADAERSRAAEHRVQAWREAEELYLPEFPAERIAELRGSIAFPPEGAPRGGR